MVVVRVHGLSVAQAERALADVWLCLEKHEIASPRIHFDFRADATMNVVFLVEGAVDANLVMLALLPGFAANDVVSCGYRSSLGCDAPRGQGEAIHLPLNKAPI